LILIPCRRAWTIEGAYLINEEVPYVYLTLTTEDVEDYQYYGIYDLYNDEIFQGLIDELADGSGEFNPRWILKFRYSENRVDMEDKLNQIIKLHSAELQRIMPIVEENKEKYQKETEIEE
jgi:hypothetical protein